MQIETQSPSEQYTYWVLNEEIFLQIFSFVPPIPFFFTTLPLINKNLFKYVFEFVTTCDPLELNYFKEMNFWNLDSGMFNSPKTKSQMDILANYLRLLFGEQGNCFFNKIRKRMFATTKILYLPFMKQVVERFFDSNLLSKFQKLETLVSPPMKFSPFSQIQEQIPNLSIDPLQGSKTLDPIPQKFIFIGWEGSFFFKLFLSPKFNQS